MHYTRRKIEGGVGALREPDDTNFLKPNDQSRNLNIYIKDTHNVITSSGWGERFSGSISLILALVKTEDWNWKY